MDATIPPAMASKGVRGVIILEIIQYQAVLVALILWNLNHGSLASYECRDRIELQVFSLMAFFYGLTALVQIRHFEYYNLRDRRV